jgi:hypothetical protein
VISLTRTGGLRPPPFDERLTVAADGTFTMWRSVSMASSLPSPIGSFAGRLDEANLAEIVTAAEAAAAEGSRTWTITPDSPVDVIEVDGANGTLGLHDGGEGAWAVLAALARPLLGTLTAQPLAAVALDLEGGAALTHLGAAALRLDLSALAVRVDQWRDGEFQHRWTAAPGDLGVVEAGPGWRLALPFDHGFALGPADRLLVHASFAAHDGSRLVPVGLQTK